MKYVLLNVVETLWQTLWLPRNTRLIMYIVLILEVMVKDNLLSIPMKINNSKCFQCTLYCINNYIADITFKIPKMNIYDIILVVITGILDV